MKPFFSVIIAVYNRENYISNAINSLINQNFVNWEAIIVDDNSSDGTLKSIKPFLSDRRLKLIQNTINMGVAKARNVGIREVNGNYITFLDSDDEYKVNHLSSRYDILLGNKIDLLHGGVEIIGNEYVPDKDDLNRIINIRECAIGGTFFINSHTSNELKYFDENIKYSEDSNMLEIFENNNMRIYKTNIQTYIYNRNLEDSICNTIDR